MPKSSCMIFLLGCLFVPGGCDGGDDDDSAGDDDDLAFGTLDLANADAKLVGEPTGQAGWDVSTAGDVNGDGFDDVFVGAPYRHGETDEPVGAAYLVLGPISGAVDLSSADATLVGENEGYLAAFSVSGAGDVNGDGYDDLLVGTILYSSGADEAAIAYLVHGPVTGTVGLSEADVAFVAEHDDDDTGSDVSAAGDVNGDGYHDVLLGSSNYSISEDGSEEGAAFLFFGPVSGTVDLIDADAILVGEEPHDQAASEISAAGDVNGDGYDDVLVAAFSQDAGGADAGAVYLVLGPVSGTQSLSDSDAKFIGEAEDDHAGKSVSGAGDVNGDGYDDILIGVGDRDSDWPPSAAAYLILGPVSGTIGLADADARFIAERDDDEAGCDVSSAGDVNGDGYSDILIGADAVDAEGDHAGTTYLVFGPVSGAVDLSTADAKLNGEVERDRAGHSVSIVGDVDGDGFDDILIGAPYHHGEGSVSGAAYLVLGDG